MIGNRICMRCGRELGTGDFGCYCALCETKDHTMTMITPYPPTPEKGWLCPRCGAINSPKLNQCVCTPRATNS